MEGSGSTCKRITNGSHIPLSNSNENAPFVVNSPPFEYVYNIRMSRNVSDSAGSVHNLPNIIQIRKFHAANSHRTSNTTAADTQARDGSCTVVHPLPGVLLIAAFVQVDQISFHAANHPRLKTCRTTQTIKTTTITIPASWPILSPS